MLFILCSLNILLLAALISGGIYAYSKARAVVTEVNQAFVDYFTADTPEGLSPFGRLIEQVAEIQAQRLGTTVTASIRGMLSGQARAIVPALEAEAVEQFPELGIAELLPKSLKKSPAAQIGLQLLLNKLVSKSPGNRSNHRESAPTQNTFNL